MTTTAPFTRRKLGQISDSIEYGLTASASKEQVGPRFLRITDIQDDNVDWESVPYCNCPDEEQERYLLRPGDIVFARTGATTGKSFLIRQCPEPTVFASYLIRVRPSEEVEPGYLAQFFRTEDYWHQISGAANGSAQPGVNGSKLRELSVPLPPFAEQRRIASILGKADDIRRKREEGIRLGEELLRSTFLEMFGDPVANPNGLPILRLEEISGDMTYGTSVKCDSENVGTALPVLRIPNILHGRIDWTDLKYVSLEPRETQQLLLTPGDLLFVRTNGNPEYIGRCAMFSSETRALFASYLIRVRLRPDADYRPEFVRFVATMPSYRSLLVAEARTTAGNYNISTQGLRRLKLIAPSLEQQDRFLRFAANTSRMLAKREEAAVGATTLFDSLVQRAFRGEL